MPKPAIIIAQLAGSGTGGGALPPDALPPPDVLLPPDEAELVDVATPPEDDVDPDAEEVIPPPDVDDVELEVGTFPPEVEADVEVEDVDVEDPPPVELPLVELPPDVDPPVDVDDAAPPVEPLPPLLVDDVALPPLDAPLVEPSPPETGLQSGRICWFAPVAVQSIVPPIPMKPPGADAIAKGGKPPPPDSIGPPIPLPSGAGGTDGTIAMGCANSVRGKAPPKACSILGRMPGPGTGASTSRTICAGIRRVPTAPSGTTSYRPPFGTSSTGSAANAWSPRETPSHRIARSTVTGSATAKMPTAIIIADRRAARCAATISDLPSGMVNKLLRPYCA